MFNLEEHANSDVFCDWVFHTGAFLQTNLQILNFVWSYDDVIKPLFIWQYRSGCLNTKCLLRSYQTRFLLDHSLHFANYFRDRVIDTHKDEW